MGTEEAFDLSAAGLRTDGSDLALSVEVLASKLEQALPQATRVQRSGRGLLGRRETHVERITVDLGDTRYELAMQSAGPDCSKQRSSGGIAIRREPLDPAAWIGALTADLQAHADTSAQARAALQELLG